MGRWKLHWVRDGNLTSRMQCWYTGNCLSSEYKKVIFIIPPFDQRREKALSSSVIHRHWESNPSFPAFQAIESSTVKLEKQTSFPLPRRPWIESSTPEKQKVVYYNISFHPGIIILMSELLMVPTPCRHASKTMKWIEERWCKMNADYALCSTWNECNGK